MKISDNIAFIEVDGLASRTILDGPERNNFNDGLDNPESQEFTSAVEGLERRNFESQLDLIQCTDETIIGPESSLDKKETLYFGEVINIEFTDK